MTGPVKRISKSDVPTMTRNIRIARAGAAILPMIVRLVESISQAPPNSMMQSAITGASMSPIW